MTTDSHYSIEITSPPDREQLVAEVWYGDTMVAEINQEEPELAIELFPSGIALDLTAFMNAVQRAALGLRGEQHS